MLVRKATETDKKEAGKIASSLSAWFVPEGLRNMKTDFKLDNAIVAVDKGKVVGFLCYSSYAGRMQLVWMGVMKEDQRKGVGKKLLDWLEKESKRLGLRVIDVETLPDDYAYEPYKQTRAFYYKNGFKKTHYLKATIEGWDDQIVLEKKI